MIDQHAEICRLPDWQARLTAYLNGIAGQRMRPGTHDCALFGAGGVAAITGVDLAAQWRGAYRSLDAGLGLLRDDGFADHVAVAARHFLPIHPAFAHPGDIAILADENGQAAMGIFQGGLIYCLRPNGLGHVSRLDARTAFHIPYFVEVNT